MDVKGQLYTPAVLSPKKRPLHGWKRRYLVPEPQRLENE